MAPDLIPVWATCRTLTEARPDTGHTCSLLRPPPAAELVECNLCRLGVEWAVLHPVDSIHDPPPMC